MKKSALPMVGYGQLAQALGSHAVVNLEAPGASEAAQNVEDPAVIAALSAVLAELEQAQSDPDVFASADDRMASLAQSYLARKAAAKPEGVVATEVGLEAKFDSNDVLGWAGSLLDWVKGLRKHDFIDEGGVPQPLTNQARIALLSDWGTGMYGAPACADSIEGDGDFDVLLHLGDVYYSGDVDEVQERFLKFWPNVPRALNRALNANHEMYSGGNGYFDHILPAFGQAASYFALRNEYWLLVGLDTGYSEHELHGAQVEWLMDLVAQAGGRKVVLFSHHQPYSLYEKQGNKLVTQLAPLLQDRRIYAWYWGHEHRCVVHDPHPAWGLRGRCVGHSGFPYFRDEFDHPLAQPGWQEVPGKNLVPAARVLDGPNRYLGGKAAKYGPNGYVVLEFDGDQLRERYFNPDGSQLPSPTVD